jgi:hypothetical protein
MWGDYARRLRYVTLEDWDDLRKMVAEHGHATLPPLTDGDDVHHGVRGRAMEYSSMMFTRETLAGEFIVVNRALVRTLEERGLWNERSRAIIMNEGSVQGSTRTSYPGQWDLQDGSMGPQAEGSSGSRRNRALRLPVPIHQRHSVSADTRQGAGGFVLWLEADQDSN